MTRQRKAVASPSDDGNRAILAPLPPARNRTAEVVHRLQAEIASGRLAAGDRLPTEHDMMSAMGVSRTVVREAVAALKAEGLVTTRQGSGAFVAQDAGRRGFRIDPERIDTLSHILQVLELRRAIEMEAAALAAARASVREIRDIAGSVTAFEAAVARGENAVPEDVAFHRAIAAATGNPHFLGLLEFLGHFFIPRQNVRAESLAGRNDRAYLDQILAEHAAIHDAIARRRPDEARAAMQAHLSRAADRYRAFAAGGTRRSKAAGPRATVSVKS